MNDFSLTSPAPTINGRDPNVFSAREGVDYGAIAYQAWLDAQVASIDLDAVHDEEDAILARLHAGLRWLEEHDAGDPAYKRAIVLRNELEQRASALAIQRECLMRVVWTACMNVYAATQHIGKTPQETWSLLRGHEPPPGAWPPQPSEFIVDGRTPHYPEVWRIEELRKQLAERTAS